MSAPEALSKDQLTPILSRSSAEVYEAHTLQCLREEAENVVHNQNCCLCTAGSSGVCLHAIDGDPFALLLVAIANDRWNCAASVGLRHDCSPL